MHGRPAFGFLLFYKPGRLFHTLLEPLRPQIDKIIFKYAASRVFERADFVELKEPRFHGSEGGGSLKIATGH
jgi:hypothetical protein